MARQTESAVAVGESTAVIHNFTVRNVIITQSYQSNIQILTVNFDLYTSVIWHRGFSLEFVFFYFAYVKFLHFRFLSFCPSVFSIRCKMDTKTRENTQISFLAKIVEKQGIFSQLLTV